MRPSELSTDVGNRGASSRSPRPFLLPLVIALVTAIAYANALPPIFAGLDAKESIRDNRYIRDLWPPSHAMSLPLLADTIAIDPGSKGGTMVRRPVLSVSFAINRALLGGGARGYHVVNVLLHLATALLLFGLIRRTAVQSGYARSDALAFAVAILWAAHPLQTESVTNLVQRAESLMGLFYVATLYAACRALSAPGIATRWIVIAVVASALGMGTKETMVTVPVAALLYDWVFFCRRPRDLLAHARLHVPVFATWTVLGVLIAFTAEDAARDFVEGKTLPYVLAQPRVILHYLRLAVWPDDLFVYINTRAFQFIPGTTPLWQFVAPALLLATVLAIGLVACWRRRPLGFPLVLFFLILAPTSSIVATSDVLQEHRLYLSLAALLVVVVTATMRVLGDRPRIGIALLVVATVALGVRTHLRNQDYHSEFGMVYPGDMVQAVIFVVRHEFAHGRIDEALELFRESLPRFPDEAHRGRAHYELANLLAIEGRAAEAQSHYETALTLMRFSDSSLRAVAHYDIANYFAARGFPEEAQTYYQQALSEFPALALAHNNLGVLLAHEGDLDGAEFHLRKAIEMDPRHVLAKATLASILAVSGREAEALAELEQIVTKMPRFEIARKARDVVRQHLDGTSNAPLVLSPDVRYLPGTMDAFLFVQPNPAEGAS